MAFYYYNLLPIISDKIPPLPQSKLFNYVLNNYSKCDEYNGYKVTLTEKGKKEYINNIIKNVPSKGFEIIDKIPSKGFEIIDKILSSTTYIKIYKDKIIEIRADLEDIKPEEEKLVHDIFMSVYTDLKSNIHDHLFSDLEKGVFIEYIVDKSLFSWDDVPNSNTELIKFLKDGLNVMWVENATINKSKDNETINITDKNNIFNIITIKLNKREEKVTLEITGSRIHEYVLKEENGKINIVPIRDIRKEIYKKYIEIKERTYEVWIISYIKQRQDVLGLMKGMPILNYGEGHTWLSKKITESRNLMGTFAYLESIIEGFEKNIEKAHRTDVVKIWISKLQDIQNSIKFGYQVFALSFVFLVVMNDLIKFILNNILNISDGFIIYLWIMVSLCISLWIFNDVVEGETKAIFDVTNIGIKHDI